MHSTRRTATGMIVPSVHMGGTSRNELETQMRDALMALASAQEALAAMTPHGRDYYVQPGEALQEALIQHESRRERVDALMTEIGAMYEEIVFGGDAQ